MRRRNIVLCIGLLSTAHGQMAPEFIINPAKPFVYVRFDHAGDRKPTSLEEPSSGLWLRLVNNCRLPIRVLGFDIGTGDPGLGLTYSVVAESAIADNEILTEMPKGYPFHVGSRITIPGGKDVLFSIPANHVTKDWHIEIDFTFALTDPK